ncbi:MAG TPA: PAS domain S-box protein, partial [Nitrospira sp.]|nr:PAS domain S-box protein [Nitrospira sp.]
MHSGNRTHSSFVPWAIPVLTFVIFILDLLTPIGVAVSVLYVLPLSLTILSTSDRHPLYVCLVATALLWADLFLKPAGVPLEYGMLNRLLGTSALWLMALGLLQYKRNQSRLATVQTDRFIAQLRLESIIQSAMDAIITVDERQHILLFNEAAERMFKCRAQEAIGRPLDAFIPPRFREDHRRHVQAFGLSGVTNRKMGELGSVKGLRPDGTEFPIEAAISHVTVESKSFFTVILRDITERMHAERLLRQNEERYRRLLAVSPLGIMVTRQDRVVLINDAGVKLFKAGQATDMLGTSLSELFDHGRDGTIRDQLQPLFNRDNVIPLVEEKLRAIDGSVLDVEMTAVGFTDEEGPAILFKFRDLSERRRLHEQLRRTERIAELGTLASGMAHEIGTPMNVILGRAEYLMDRVSDEAVKRGLQTIISQVERITKVMNQLLAFARRKSPDRAPLALREVIDNSLEMFQERLVKAGVHVDVETDEPCPKILADVDQMSQVLINLIMNALHAMPQGGTLR